MTLYWRSWEGCHFFGPHCTMTNLQPIDANGVLFLNANSRVCRLLWTHHEASWWREHDGAVVRRRSSRLTIRGGGGGWRRRIESKWSRWSMSMVSGVLERQSDQDATDCTTKLTIRRRRRWRRHRPDTNPTPSSDFKLQQLRNVSIYKSTFHLSRSGAYYASATRHNKH